MSQRSRFKQKGRGGASFVQIPHFVLRSEQWAKLGGSEIKLLMELAGQYNGRNNGDLSATYTDLRLRGWSSNDVLQRALKGLEASSWILRTRQGGRHIGCNLFAVTWWAIDQCDGKHDHPVEAKAGHLWKNAIGRPESGQRKAGFRTAKPLAVRNTDSKAVPLRPAA